MGSLKRTNEVYTVSMEIEQDGRRTALSITDTPDLLPVPGTTKELKAIGNHINNQCAHSFSEESKLRRNIKSDTQVNVCLCFLSSFVKSHLSSLEKDANSILSSQINVIPVIGKADTITMAQVEHLKYTIKNEFFDNSGMREYGHFDLGRAGKTDGTNFLRVIDIFEKSFAKEDVDAHAMVDYIQHIPYTTISPGEDCGPIIDGSWMVQLGRLYLWSFLEYCKPVHCGLLLLKMMLLSTHGHAQSRYFSIVLRILRIKAVVKKESSVYFFSLLGE